MPSLDEMFTEKATERRARVAPAPALSQDGKLKLIQEMLQAQGAPVNCAKLNAWLLRCVGTAQIVKGIADGQ